MPSKIARFTKSFHEAIVNMKSRLLIVDARRQFQDRRCAFPESGPGMTPRGDKTLAGSSNKGTKSVNSQIPTPWRGPGGGFPSILAPLFEFAQQSPLMGFRELYSR